MSRRSLAVVQAVLSVASALTIAAMLWVAGRPGGAPKVALAAPYAPPLPVTPAAGTTREVMEPERHAMPPMPTSPPVSSPTPSPTPSPAPMPLPAATSAPQAAVLPGPPQPVGVNGIAFETIVQIPPEVMARAREIGALGRMLGRDPRAYSKVGDSTIENPHFLARFDGGPYDLGAYAHLQPAIDQFLGSHSRDSIAVRVGLHSWSANDPAWAEPGLCLPNETPVACEIRRHNPSIIFICLGTNDVGAGHSFDHNIRQIVETAVNAGVVPVLGTKGDRREGSTENNDILRRIAADYQVPLWDYDRVADTLPGRGLDVDAAHMNTFYAHDYRDPLAFTRGHAMHNLTALMALDAVWRLVGGQ